MKRPDASTDGPAFCVQGIWVHMAVCRLLAFNVGSLARIVGSRASPLPPNASRKRPVFTGPSAAVCGPLQIPGRYQV
jgi:hypothetical protein